MITVSAPAKINLTLEVLGKRPDGYHEIRSVMQTISLADILSFEPAEKLTITSDQMEWDGEKSLVSRAARLLADKTGTSKGAAIHVRKSIPLMSGLGGDSTDAAATLTGLNQLWDLGLHQEDLISMGRELGSDVAFFFYGGTALATGRGDIVIPLPPTPTIWILLFLPETASAAGKTGRAYQSLLPTHYTDGKITDRLISELGSVHHLDESLIFNTFENVVFSQQPELEIIRQHVLKMGVSNVHLAGSGNALFSVFDNRDRAAELNIMLANQKIWHFVAKTV